MANPANPQGPAAGPAPDYAALANLLGDFFENVAEQVSDRIDQGVGNLTDAQLADLESKLDQLTNSATSCYEKAERIAFAGLATYIQGIQNAVTKTDKDLKTIADINKAISITAAVLGIAVGVLTENGSLISQAMTTIGNI